MVVDNNLIKTLGVIIGSSDIKVEEPPKEAIFANFVDNTFLSDSSYPYYFCESSGEWSVEDYKAISSEDILLEDLRDQMLHILHAYVLDLPLFSEPRSLGKKEGYIRIVDYSAAGTNQSNNHSLISTLRRHDRFLFKRKIDSIDLRIAQEKAALDEAFEIVQENGDELLEYVGGLVDRLGSLGINIIK